MTLKFVNRRLCRMHPFDCFLMFFQMTGGVVFDRCMLHNFAGNIEMYGILDAIASGPIEARTSANSTMASYSFLLVTQFCTK